MELVTLGMLWLNAVADRTDVMSFDLNALDHAPMVNVTARPYAGGTYRMVTTPGKQRTAKVTLGFCTDVQTAWLKAHQGVLLWFRDPRGEKFAGFYTDSVFTPRILPNLWSVPFTVTEVTLGEGV